VGSRARVWGLAGVDGVRIGAGFVMRARAGAGEEPRPPRLAPRMRAEGPAGLGGACVGRASGGPPPAPLPLLPPSRGSQEAWPRVGGAPAARAQRPAPRPPSRPAPPAPRPNFRGGLWPASARRRAAGAVRGPRAQGRRRGPRGRGAGQGRAPGACAAARGWQNRAGAGRRRARRRAQPPTRAPRPHRAIPAFPKVSPLPTDHP
jgi:hypothetical protein